ncbi:MAG: hypothetical protein ACR2GW_11240 [Pyrinomonadaceae bacterium]|jgi:thioredoxin-like negative regulator of GroEL|nr:hypothetical protein [Pyrinomonadaceae bacterium]
MSQTITITLPNEIYQPLADAASQEGRTIEELAAARLARTVITRSAPRADEAGRKRVSDFIGAWDSGDPNSADNERIDADLAREYGATHDEE